MIEGIRMGQQRMAVFVCYELYMDTHKCYGGIMQVNKSCGKYTGTTIIRIQERKLVVEIAERKQVLHYTIVLVR